MGQTLPAKGDPFMVARMSADFSSDKQPGDDASRPQAEADPSRDDTAAASGRQSGSAQPDLAKELGGPKGPEPTRYGDWERKGRCSDF